ncbi:ABC transporter substrate-binding protein [Paenibacillus sp. GYB003]|uniref:ABC transporter substrate-binding protein n=1 Tax=Paenibacillus sp. GYB003 TaxID=2994392 RepID=UPI002F9685E7
MGKAESFEAGTGNIRIRIEQANGNFEVLNRIRSGEPGDLIHLSESVFAPYLRQGHIIDLMPFLREDSRLSADDFYKGALEGPSVDGKLAALPVDMQVPLNFYRKRAFEEAGIAEPANDWTFGQFLETAARLTNEKRYGFRLGIDLEWFEPFVKRSGGAYLSADGATAKGYADSEATAEALRRIVDWFRVHRIVPRSVEGGGFGETFAMAFDFSWCLPYVLRHHADEYGVVGLPRTAEGADTNMVYMGGYGISAACKHPELAWLLLKELSAPETGGPLSLLPATKPIARRLRKTDHPVWGQALAELDKASKSAFYVSRKWNANRQIFNQDLVRWIDEGADVKASLKRWAELTG